MPQFSLEEQFLAEERERLKREQEQRRAARAAASIAQPANPQRTAEANKLARQVGQPPEYVEQNLDAVKQQQRAAAARKAAASNPTLGAWMEYARNGALAQDDVGVLESIGDTVAGWLRNSGASRDIYENAKRGVFASDASSEDGFFDRMGSLIERGGAAVDEGIYNFIAGTTGSTVAREAAQTLSGGTTSRKVAGQTDWEAVKNKPSLSNIGGYIIDAGAESLPAMTALAVPVAGIGLIGVSQTGNIAAERARNNGRDEITGRDIGLSLGFGFGTAALDRLGFKGIFGTPAATVRGRIGRAAATEGTTEFLQSGLEYTGGSIGTDVGFDPMTALDQSIAGAVAGYGLGGGIRSTIEVARSARSIEAVDRLMTRSAESQVRQRDPDSFRNLIEQLTGSASDGNIYVSGEVIAQFNQDYAEDEFWGQFAEEIDDARLTGGDVAIPLSSAAAELSGKPDWEAIRGDVRAAPGAMTANEIAAAEAEWETIRKEAGEALDTQEREARAAAAPGERLRASIRETLMTRGMDPDQAAANAEVTAALFETEAANLGYDLTGREFEKAVSVQRVLPGMVADPEAADTLDVIVNAMRGNGEAEIGVGPTLMEFIRDRGGINDPGGDLRSMGVSPRLIRDFNPDQGSLGGLSGAGDYGIDTVMRAAVEAGYFPDLATTGSNELDTQRMLDAIGAELAGSPVYSETRLDQMRQAGAELRELLASAGLEPDTASMDDIRAAVDRFDGGRSLEQSLPATIEIDGVEQPTVNSEGQPLAATEEGVRAFWAWFGDSKVVDADGRPLVVYHGGQLRENEDSDAAFEKSITFFSPDRPFAENYAGPVGNVTEAYVRSENPFLPDQHANAEWLQEFIDYWREEDGWVDRSSGEDLSDYEVRQLIEEVRLYGFSDGNMGRERWDDFLAHAADHHDGFIGYDPTDGADIVVAFGRENIKSVNNRGTFSPDDARILYQKQRFYSALERAVEETKTNRAPAQQWLATLRKTPGVKAEELEWSGLEEWLEIQEGPVEKSAVLQVVRDGGIKVEEVVLGGDITERLDDYYQYNEGDYYVEDEGDGDFVVRDKDGNFVERYDNEDQAEEHASLWNDEIAAKQSEPKFKDWSTDPNSESYRELLITLPVNEGGNPDRAPGTHWDQPAVVAHTRFMEKRGPDGERILFVEEVQSDWHQKGRDQGYAVPAELDAARERYKKASDAWQAAYAEAVAMGVPSDSTSPMQDLINLNTPEADAFAEKMSSLGLRLQEAQIAKDNAEKGGIPDAPFKSTWPALVMKRVISWAAENGYDQVAWTTGEQQAERYSLSESVGSILAVRQDDGRYLVETGNPDAMEVLFSNSMAETEPNSFHKGLMTAEQLKEAFGGNIAEQLIEGADASFEAWAEGDRLGDDVLVARLEGRDEEADAMAARIVELNETLPSQRGFRLEGEENLRVGGEGMKAFYDRNLGNITNKIIKKYGVKVEPKVVEGMGALNNRLKATREDIQRVAGISAYGIKTVADAEARIRKYDQVLNDPQEGPRVKEETRAAKARLTTALPMIAKAEKLSAEPMEPTNLGFDITPEMRADVLESGFSLFQRGQGPQGSIQFGAEGQALIRLFESANASTFQHEMAHFWLERMFANARQAIDTDGNPAARQTFADVEAIKAWFKDNGHPVEGDTIPTEAHEMFARAWEQYLMEGKAPTTRLQSAFRKFSRWLKMIYRTVANLNTPMTPEIREVMDRMLATEQQIAEAAEARAAYLQFDNAIEAGMSEADARRYAELSEQVRSEAEEQLTGKVMRSIRAQGQKQWKAQEKVVRAEVEEMVDNRPPFAALKLLRQKDGPRLDKAWLQENFGEDVFGILPAGMPVHKVGGINPDTLAELVGFSSGDQLVRELIGIEARRRSMKEGGDKRPVREAIIAQEVKAEMNRRFGDPLADGTIEREASAAVQNDRLGEKVELELKALASKAGRKPTPYRMAREWARDRIQRGVIADMISGAAQYRYTRTAAKAARDAQSAILAGDMEAAFRHKQTELLHNALAREAAEASDQVDVAVRRLGKYAKQTKAKTLPLDYLDRIHTLLEGVEFKKVSQRGLDKRKALRDWIASEEAEGRTVELPERVLDEVDQKNWSRLTVEELMLLKEAVDQIAALGRLKTKLLTAKKDREVEAAATAMEQAIIASKKGPKPNRTRETLGYRAASAFKSFKAMHRKMASLAREMDSVKDGGPVWDNLIRPMMERFDQEAEMNREATEKLLDILSPFYGRDSLGRPKMGGKGIYFESIGQSFNLEERMAIVGQMGNAGNLQRLIDGERGEFGFRWSMEQLNEIKASLTKEQMDAVQAIWDLFESYRPLIAAKERRVSGVEPEWVEPVPVETEHGTYKGGYWPIKYDPARSTEAQKQADAAEAERQLRGAFTAATTQRSFTKQRAERVTNRPLLYSFSGVTQGLTDVVHDLAFHEYLIDANRLLRHPKVSSAMLNYYGPEIMQQFRKGIEDVAAGATPAQNVWEQGVNHVRMGATVAGLGWNLKTALLQPFGLTQSIVRVGAPWILKGATQFFGSPIDTSRAVYEKSRFMRERSNTMQREISEIRNRIRGGTKGGEFINASFFFMITRTQLAIDLPTWQGAYEKAIAEGNEESLAVSLADQAVRDAQGGGQIGDLSAIQRGGPLQKLFTNFYSFFNTTFNLTAESWARTDFRKPGDVMALALDYLLLYSLPAAMGYFLEMAFAGEDDDDDRSLLEGLASEHISYMTGTMVGLRELDAPIQNLVEAATGAELNEYDFGYTGPAGLRFFADGTRAAQQAAQGEFDDALRKSMINTGGILFHLPSGQINKTWSGAEAIANDDTDNPMALVSGN